MASQFFKVTSKFTNKGGGCSIKRAKLAEVVLSQWSGAGFTIGTIDLEEVWSIKEVLSLANDITRTQLESAAFLFKNS